MFSMFPDEDRFGRLFRRLLPVGALISVPSCLLWGVLVLLGRERMEFFGFQIGGVLGFILCLVMIPFLTAAVALVGSVHLYFGRRIPGLRMFYPRNPGKKRSDSK